VRLVDGNGRTIRWDPRLGAARHINVFNRDERDLAEGDRIQWRLASKELDLKNAERGTVEQLEAGIATVRWDRGNRTQQVDLGEHKYWDHGYAETVYSAQSKTYARVYVLAPVGSGLVNGQNYYTAITRARFGAKLWTEDRERLAEKLTAQSGEKTSSLEGLGRLGQDRATSFALRHDGRLTAQRAQQRVDRGERQERLASRSGRDKPNNLAETLAARARGAAEIVDRWLGAVVETHRIAERARGVRADRNVGPNDTEQRRGGRDDR
jgi:hypothetical protein